MFKFINTKENAPSFHTASFEFDHGVDYSRESALNVHINLASTKDNIAVIYLNSYGLDYKHSVSIDIIEGTASEHKTKFQDNSKSDFFYLSSPTGRIKISDPFTDAFISWTLNENTVQITTSEDDSVIIDFEQGVIDPNIQKHIDKMLSIYETMPHTMRPHMWKTIASLRNKFGLINK